MNASTQRAHAANPPPEGVWTVYKGWIVGLVIIVLILSTGFGFWFHYHP